jgi:hypothetical protein
MVSLRRTIAACLLLIIVLTAGCGSANTENQLPKSKPKDFNFVLNYGVNAINELNTVKGTYTKDLVGDGTITTGLKLSEKEMKNIYKEMRDIDILNYPAMFAPESKSYQTPFPTYLIKIYYNGSEKRIYWVDDKDSKTKEAVRLRELFQKIHEIVIDKDEYKKLPPIKGGYV